MKKSGRKKEGKRERKEERERERTEEKEREELHVEKEKGELVGRYYKIDVSLGETSKLHGALSLPPMGEHLSGLELFSLFLSKLDGEGVDLFVGEDV